MSDNNICGYSRHSEKLISAFISDYLEKLFYFCLKKTNNRQESEDLASDISLNIITELKKGVIPDRFSAWVWTIARNRYCFWANKKRIKNNSVSNEDICDVKDEKDFESALVHGEDLKLLRRELSFISRDYRDIVVAFYIDDLKIKTIAQMLNLPENTVTSKLYRSRKILKEGMNMAREFGIRSYKPEDIGFMVSGSSPSGLPKKVLQRKLPKNILLQANNNPSTIEELAVEIGIAAPYMEEEVQILVDAELLKETNGKYVTNFFIMDKDCRLEIYHTQRKQSKERSKILDEIIKDIMPEIRKLGIIGDTISDNDFKWLIIPGILETINNLKFDKTKAFNRKDGSSWGIMGDGYLNILPERVNIWFSRNKGNIAITIKCGYGGYEKIGCQVSDIDSRASDLFADIIKNNRNINSITNSEKSSWEIIKSFVQIDGNGNITPTIAVFKDGGKQKLFDILKSHEKYAQLENMYSNLFDEVEEILKQYSNPILHEQLGFYVSMFNIEIWMMTINDEVEAGRLTVPENPENSTAGMYLEIY